MLFLKHIIDILYPIPTTKRFNVCLEFVQDKCARCRYANGDVHGGSIELVHDAQFGVMGQKEFQPGDNLGSKTALNGYCFAKLFIWHREVL